MSRTCEHRGHVRTICDIGEYRKLGHPSRAWRLGRVAECEVRMLSLNATDSRAKLRTSRCRDGEGNGVSGSYPPMSASRPWPSPRPPSIDDAHPGGTGSACG